jgi:mono/diheme cytochrome c family protein
MRKNPRARIFPAGARSVAPPEVINRAEQCSVLRKTAAFPAVCKTILPVLVLAAFSFNCHAQTSLAPPVIITDARTLFLKNCAHCHAADASGDDGPDLHGIGWTSEEIGKRIRNGKKGQMTAFAGKLQPAQINALVAYVEHLK